MPTLEDLKVSEPDAAQASTTDAVASGGEATLAEASTGEASTAEATDAALTTADKDVIGEAEGGLLTAASMDATTREVSPEETSAFQLNQITSQSSPLMQRAKQQGMLTAASRGLQNSSIAAGAAQGAMVDRALPLAQQDAATYGRTAAENMAATNRAAEAGIDTDISKFNVGTSADLEKFNAASANALEEFNAKNTTQVSEFNADAQSKMSALNAQLETAISENNAKLQTEISMQLAELETQVSTFNADAANKASAFNAEQVNQFKAEVLRLNTDLNKQFLAGEQAKDLADIQGQYQQLISTNETAANLYNSYFDGIAAAMANKDISPARIAQYITVQQDMLESGLSMISQINDLGMTDFGLPDVSGYGPTHFGGSTESGITSSPSTPDVEEEASTSGAGGYLGYANDGTVGGQQGGPGYIPGWQGGLR
jgi:hypothetical protein